MRNLLRKSKASRSDAGITLAELMVTMMVVSIVFAVAAAMFISAMRQNGFAIARTTSQADARIAMEHLSRDLRVAVLVNGSSTPFTVAEPTKLEFYTSRGASTATAAPKPVKVTYEVATSGKVGCLKRTEIVATGSVGSYVFAPATAKSSCVAPGPFDTSTPLYTFWRVQQDAVTPATQLAATPALADTKWISSVRVRFSVRAAQQPDISPTIVDQDITLINQTNLILNGNIK